jgi:hypothetical protein
MIKWFKIRKIKKQRAKKNAQRLISRVEKELEYMENEYVNAKTYREARIILQEIMLFKARLRGAGYNI